MNWELIGWALLAVSGLIIVASLATGRGGGFVNPPASESVAPPIAAGDVAHPLDGWLELAWPIFMIVALGMLALKEILTFPAVLLLATVLTGLIWLFDALTAAKKRGDAREPALIETAKSFFPVILIVFFLRSFLYEPFKIPSESMLPTLHVGDFILVNKFNYGVRLPVANKKIMENGSPQRGDVMVFRLPENPNKDLIKRVVGIPGDRVVYAGKRLTINDQPVPVEGVGEKTTVDSQLGLRRFESFREKLGSTTHTSFVDTDAVPVNLGGLRQFAFRDQCQHSSDGFICKVPAGHYFMMGDNRDNSDDSRYWGFVPDENIVGKAVYIWLNVGSLGRSFTKIE